MNEIITPDEIQALLQRPALRFELIDGHRYVDEKKLPLVTSPNIFEPNSNQFHPRGLFSEEIFGPITSMDRFVNEAAIALNTLIIHPVIFHHFIGKKNIYVQILSGKQYGKFDVEADDFVLCGMQEEDAGTGFEFFVRNLKYLAKSEKKQASLRSENIRKLLTKYHDRMLISHVICLPAGLRDLDMKSSRLSKDDINKIYMSVINIATSLSGYALSTDTLFDGIRYQLQMKIDEIYAYIMNVISGKKGFFEKHYGARKIAYSTRNVISVPMSDADTADDPTNIKTDETMIPMLNLIKCFQPFFVHFILKRVYGELFLHGNTGKIAVTNPKTLEIEYVALKASKINMYTTADGVEKIINQFKHVGFRESAVSIRDSEGKEYWLLLSYTEYDTVYIAKSASDLERLVKQYGIEYEKNRVEPVRWIEILYIAAMTIVDDKHVFITRYPALGDGSIYPSRIHAVTTNPSKIAKVMFDTGLTIETPHYPVIGNPYYESVVVHQSRLSGLGADFDGDMVSVTGLWSKEGNDDIRRHMENVNAVVGDDMQLKLSTDSDIINLTIFNLSRQDIQ